MPFPHFLSPYPVASGAKQETPQSIGILLTMTALQVQRFSWDFSFSHSMMPSGSLREAWNDKVIDQTKKLEQTNDVDTTWSKHQLNGTLPLTVIIAMHWCLCVIWGYPSQQNSQTQWDRKWCYEIVLAWKRDAAEQLHSHLGSVMSDSPPCLSKRHYTRHPHQTRMNQPVLHQSTCTNKVGWSRHCKDCPYGEAGKRGFH